MSRRIIIFIIVCFGVLTLVGARLHYDSNSPDYVPYSGRFDVCTFCEQLIYQYYNVIANPLHWTQSKVDSIQGWSDSYKLAVEFTDGPDGGFQTSTATGYWYSNLPNPTYQRSDDDANGIREEVKIVAQNPKTIQAGWDYYAGAHYRWQRSFSSTNEMNLGAQKVVKIGDLWKNVSSHWITKVFYDGGPSCLPDGTCWFDTWSGMGTSAATIPNVLTTPEGSNDIVGEVVIGDHFTYIVHKLSDGRLAVEMHQPDTQDLELYAQINRNLAKSIVARSRRVPIVLTFAQPLSINAANGLVELNDLEPARASLRAVNEFGDRITLGVVPRDGVAVSANYIERLMSDIQRVDRGQNLELSGVISVAGIAGPQTLQELLVDSRVYVVDVMQTVLREAVATKFNVPSFLGKQSTRR